MRQWSVTSTRLPRNIPILPPPPIFQTCSEIREERDEFSPIEKIHFPREASHSFFGLFFDYMLLYYIQGIYIIYTCTLLLISGFGGGPTEQPPLAPNGRALNQPKPYPSNRTVWMFYVTSNDRLIRSAPRRLPTGRP